MVKLDGEIQFDLSFGNLTLPIDGLVDSNILAGVPFCDDDIVLSLKKEIITIQGHEIPYGYRPESIQHDAFHLKSVILHNDRSKVVYPGDYVEVSSDQSGACENEDVTIEPRIDSPLEGD